ncbi:MAG: transcriptional activator NhaR [Betaproteobacteria bacterium]|nr:MAG: transcriptional activator NhaR [Betaproteobacteria bacterium]
MATINFKHLRYFWAIAKSGSIARASAQLHVTPQSISSQLAELEDALGTGLFRRVGRGLEMTDIGRRIVSYAEEIFGLEDELLAVVRDQGSRSALPFRIGIADSVPKSLTYRVVEPALHMDEDVRLFCKEGRLVSLLADLSVHRLDMVIADRAMPTDLKVRAYNHLLGSSDVTVFGTEALVQTLNGTFPALVDGAPFLLPSEEVAIRPALEQWFETQRVRPRIVGEFDDSAMLKAFGQGGAGLFFAPTAIADYVCRQYDVRAVGRIESVVEQLYAITTERRMQHPAAIAISQAASREVFGVAGARSVPSSNGFAKPQRQTRASSKRARAPESPRKSVRSVK